MSYKKNIKHIYENYDLTFNDIKEIFTSLSQGKINVYEKFDGANLLVKFDYENNKPLLARSISDVRKGGLTKEELSKRFTDDNVAFMFHEAYSVLENGLSKISKNLIEECFNDNWISCEIVSKQHQNFIKYDENRIIFHKTGLDKNEKQIMEMKTDSLFEELNEVSLKEKEENWKLSGPQLMKLNSFSLGEILEFNHKLNMLRIKGRSENNSTLKEFYQKWLIRKLQIKLSPSFFPSKIKQISEYMLKSSPSIKLNDIKKNLSSEQKNQLKNILNDSKNILNEIKRPLEILVHNFSNRIFKNVKSCFVKNHNEEILRQRNEMKKLIENIKNINNEDINFYIKKLGSLNNITSSCEGIVFNHNNKIIKLEGNYIIYNRLKYLYEKFKR